jgi:MoxR-like ATPase
MAERSMAFSDLVDGAVRAIDLSPAFTVIGTGNPFHYGGMAQKNEAVFDRFGMGFDMPHPDFQARKEMLKRLDSPASPAAPTSAAELWEGIPGLELSDGEEPRPLGIWDVRLAAQMVAISPSSRKNGSAPSLGPDPKFPAASIY